MSNLPHICVCICTYKRLHLLGVLLDAVATQETGDRFTVSIVVADNDGERSAEPVVRKFEAAHETPIVYCVQKEQNIALTRNKSIEHAKGDFIALIDDDEVPIANWLLILFEAMGRYEVDGVLGPVFPDYEEEPAAWVVQGGYHDRPSYPTGYVIDWRKGRTGNVLLKGSLFDAEEPPFREEFLTGEDQDFFRRMIEKGHSFVWCHEAVAYENVPAARCKLSFMLRRALLRGKIAREHPTSGLADVAKSVVAVAAYTLAMPLAAFKGRHGLATNLIKLCDHAGKVLASIGIDPVREKYVSE